MEGKNIKIRICPTCGSDKVRHMHRNWCGEYQGRGYTVPTLEYYECPECGEKIYDREAMRKIEACSPAFSSPRPNKKSA